ncbi:hypothetical protein PGH47_00945 [Streptomyces sp. HUAS 31]|uniref:hypothetical protein n=1 Tax=Streptomyces TaxID=1883 RepID=UPI00230624F6|nr:hypothetical protein [Streptomyces sp. HUAS 31]WCD94290.1 hypothetical protein PGH47_00945 [Streptomyces sp. HUAS 31]
MRTTRTKARWLATAVAGAALSAGCGSTAPSTPAAVSSATASPPPFGQQEVQAELEAAAVAAGIPEGLTELGSGPSPESGETEKERKLAALMARLSPCTVSWTHDGADAASSESEYEAESDPDQSRQQLDVLLSNLGTRGWKKSGAAKEMPVGDLGTYFMATYKKQGWTLNARHNTLSTWNQSTVMVTEDACFGRLTDEEAALLED